ncbi:hypothetical protein BU25DRAFT_470100, partial [Macroventuria anomochaeta]
MYHGMAWRMHGRMHGRRAVHSFILSYLMFVVYEPVCSRQRSVTLLFILQHAIRRERTDFETFVKRRRGHDLDSRHLESSSRNLHAGGALLETYGVQDEGKHEHKWYHGEYLSQGRVEIPEGAMTLTTLKDLEVHDLYRFYPDFDVETEKLKLCIRVLGPRQKF